MKLHNSKSGFTLIELLVVIGILAVLAAIAIPSVAGLIDRANVSADATNANEMTNAFERFASEYELYRQDLASGVVDLSNLDSMQGRVVNVIKATTRDGIEKLESETGLNGRKIDRDTKYPLNAETARAIIENYTKTSSSTFEPKQSDKHFWYSPDCGVVVVADPNSSVTQRNELIVSGMDAKGNTLSETTGWIDLTASFTGNGDKAAAYVKFGVSYLELNTGKNSAHYYFYEDGTWEAYDNNELTYRSEAGELMYEDDKIMFADDGYVFFTVSQDGKTLYSEGEEWAVEGKPFPLKFGKRYVYRNPDPDGHSTWIIFYADGSFECMSRAHAEGGPGSMDYHLDTLKVDWVIASGGKEYGRSYWGSVSPDGEQFTFADGDVAVIEDW